MDSEPIIQFENVSFSYVENIPVLTEVKLTVKNKESVCIVGPNGGGKSTFLNLILGILKPNNGTVKVFGNEPVKIRKRIGYMPQYTQFDNQFPVSVMDVVLMGRIDRHFIGRYSQADRNAAESALAEMAVDNLKNRLFSTLSGGQRQRVLIARALVCSPDLLLLDEPMANVDPAAEKQFFEKLNILNQRMAVLIVSHDLGFVSQHFQTVICVNRYVHVHPTSELTGEIIKDVYGSAINMVRHDHCCLHSNEKECV